MSYRPLFALLLGAIGGAVGLAACSEGNPGSSGRPAKEAPKANREANRDGGIAKAPAPDAATTTTSAPLPEVPADAPMIGALFLSTPIMSDMEWPAKDDDAAKKRDRDKSVMRIGYIRQGSKVPVIPEAHPKSNCKEGWYELVQGGFVCGKYASLDLNHPRMKVAPHPPNLAGPLPYEYGYNIQHGTPLYRTIPSREERLKLEPWLAPKKAKPKPKPEEENAAAYGDDLDAGAPLQLAKATTSLTATTTDPFGLGESGEPTTPWYLRDHDGGKPQITLDELKGEGPVSRRMVKGFFVALDKDMRENGARWWKTTGNLIAPYERIYQHKSASEFKGVWLNETPAADANAGDGGAPVATRLPTPDICKAGSKSQVGIILYYKAKKYELSPSRKAAAAGDSLPRHSVVRLTGETVNINGAIYEQTDEGFWVRSNEMTKTKPGEPPRDLAPGEKWIDVNVKTQTLVAYEGDKAVYATAVSTGKEDKQDKEKDHHTPTGTWRIREKHIAATMDGDVASDGPYSIEDVPWIMYFNGSYALHGAFWHNNFGRMQSHGCVNLAPKDARELFGWTEPRMPDGWHGVWSTPEKQGTRVVVHE